jgi:hypothetical protein
VSSASTGGGHGHVDFGGESYLAANVYMCSVEEEEEDGGCGLDKD